MSQFTKTLLVLLTLSFVLSSFGILGASAQNASSPPFTVVGKIALPSGFTMQNTNTLPFAYLQPTSTLFVFAQKISTGALNLLALSPSGAQRATPIRFGITASGFYAFDQKDSRLFYAENDRVIVVSTMTYKVVGNYSIVPYLKAYGIWPYVSSFAYNPSNGLLYVTGATAGGPYGNNIMLFNAATNAFKKSIALNEAYNVIYDSKNGIVYAVFSRANDDTTGVVAISGMQVLKKIILTDQFCSDISFTCNSVLNAQHSMLFVYSANEATTNCPKVIGVNVSSWSLGATYGETLTPPTYADSRGVVYGEMFLAGGGVQNYCSDIDPGYLPTITQEYSIAKGSLVTSCNNAGSILSVPQLKVNFVSQCTTKGTFQMNVYSATTGSLLAKILGNSIAFGYDPASNMVYAAGSNNYIYKIQG